MRKVIFTFLAIFTIASPYLFELKAQDNLQVQFENQSTVPDFLNICGDADNETVRISLNGAVTNDLSNLTATLNLFKGVQFESFDIAGSSSGITVDASDPTKPVFTLPDLSTSGSSFVLVSFNISANCEYIDTITTNDMAEVFDTWDFEYDMGVMTNVQESDVNLEYRDAFAVPSFTMGVSDTLSRVRVGDCFDREVLVTNSGLDGFVDTIYYENLQGDGIYVQEVLVNGVAIPFTKILDVSGDTLISALIDGTHFVNNTVGMGSGNGNVFFDPDETVTITEQICVLSCDDSRASNHKITWGCGGRSCTETSIPDFIRIGEGGANIVVVNSGTIPNENTGYCKPGINTITFTNDGVEVDTGFAAMIDIAVGVGLGNTFALSENAFNITGIRIGSVDLASPAVLNFLDGDPLFLNSDPDGAGVGLEDLDNDGYYDDLGQNESFEIVVFYEFDCSQAQDIGDGSCGNNFSTIFNARIDHTNQCLDRLTRIEESYFSSTNSRGEPENFRDTDAYVEEDTFTVIHTQSRGVFGFDKDCPAGAQYRVAVVLPSGVDPIASQTFLYQNGGTTPIPLINNTISNDTLYLEFDASSPVIGGDMEVHLSFLGDCSATLGPTLFPMEFSYYCADCDCKHIWYCGDLEGPTLHARIPPCPPGTVTCPIGVQTMEFEVNRTTFGYTDNTYTTPYDQNLANKKIAISCDSVEMKLMNIVGDTPISDSIGVVITYNNVDGSMSTDETFLFGDGTLRLTNGGNEYFYSITPANVSRQTVDSTQILTFDLDESLISQGLTLVMGDTIEFISNFSLNPDGPFETDFLVVPNLRAYAYSLTDDIEYACDNFGENFTIGKSQTVLNVPNSNSFPEGCEEAFLQYQLITVNNGFGEPEHFGNEIRQAVKIDSIRFKFDRAVLDAFSIFEPEVSIPGHPVHGNGFFPVAGFDTVSDSIYVASFDTLTSVPSLNNVQSYSFNFRIRVVPNCKSITGSTAGDNRFDFDPTIYFVDRFYASVIGDGSCVEPIITAEDNDIFYTDPPTFSLSPLTNPNFSLYGDTAVWEIQHCNTSFTSDAGLTWLAIEESTGVIEVVSIEDISIPATPVSLTIESYGPTNNNYFAFTPGVVKADGSSPIDQICNTIRIKALVSNCGTTNLNARVGWNCIAYSEPSWNPELYPPCTDLTLPLSVIALEPFLDANIIEQPLTPPDICDTSTIAILLRNTDLGAIYDVLTQITTPLEGMILVPGSFEIAYPSSAPFIPALTDPVSVGFDTKGEIFEYNDFSQLHAYLDQNGLMGFDPISPTDSNEMVIRYQFTTDCDYKSGSLSFYSFQGTKGCGEPSNFETGETLPIEINGADPTGNKVFDVAFSNNSALIPNISNMLEITVVNQTSEPTDETSDKVSLQLPLDVTYDPSSTVTVIPATWTTNTEPQIDTVGGLQVLSWCLPSGLLQNDTARFQFNLSSPDFDCSILDHQVGLFTISRTQLFCDRTAEICDIDDITSTNNGQQTTLPVLQKMLEIDLDAVLSTCQPGDEEAVTISGSILNPGVDFLPGPFTIRYFFDVDNSGMVNAGDLEINNFIENGPIDNGDALPFSHTLDITTAQACGLIVQIDTTGLGLCDASELALGDPTLLNAGQDQLFCEVSPTTIVTNIGEPDCNGMAGYTYNWLAIAPASITHLSANNIPDPILTVNHDAIVEDTLMYILETTRPACGGINRDTVNIIRGLGVVIDPIDTVYVLPGGSSPLSVLVTNGSAPYTYNWAPASTLDDPTSAMPTATPTGDTDYMVTVTSAIGCSAVETVVVINSNAIIATIMPGDTSICPDATLQLLAGGGTDYLWEADPSNPPGGMLSASNISNPIFSGGLADSVYQYDVIVTDPNFPSFVDTAEITITILPEPEILITKDPLASTCAGDQVTLTASGADNYTWIDAATGIIQDVGPTLVVSPTSQTVYQVYGSNAAGCIDTSDITINLLPTPVVLTPIADLQNCSGNTFAISIELDDDIQFYNISGSGAFANDLVVNNNTLTFDATYTGDPSTFDVTLTAASTGCMVTESFVINSCFCIPADLTSVTVVEATCGNTDGSAMVKVEGNESDYNYTWTPDLGTANSVGNVRTNLPAGGYEVQINNQNDPTCFTTVDVLINNTDGPSANVTTTAASCSATDGTASLSPASLIYRWEDGSDLATRIDLSAGTYFVTVTHPGDPDCPGIMQVTIDENNTLAATVQVDIQPDCGSSNGEVTINVTGGSGNYSYSWSGGNNTQTNLSAGMHTLTITDNDGTMCALPFSFVLTDDVPAAIVVINGITNENCVDANDGFVDFSVNFDGAFAFPSTVIISDGTNEFTNGNLPPGDYCIVITDANGCIAGGTCFTIEPAEELSLLFILDQSCEGEGSIDLTAVGGTAPYTVNWGDLAGTDNQEDRNNLIANAYNVTVTDANGCTRADVVDLAIDCPCTPPQVSSIVAVETQCGETSGSAVINLTTDEGAYTFAWFPNIGIPAGGRNARTNLPFGGYTVEIADTSDINCSTTVEFIVTNTNGPDPVVTVTPANCEAADGTASFSPTNFTYEWEDAFEGASRNDLAAGIYFVTVVDPTDPDCPNVALVEIETENPLTATTNITVAPDCGMSTGEIELIVSGGSGNYTFTWEDGLVTTSNIRTGLAGGLYMVSIRDNDINANCEIDFTFVLEHSNPTATIVMNDTLNISCDGMVDGGIDFTINYDAGFNGTPDTIITDGDNVYPNGNLPAGNYCLYILDDANCIAGSACFTIQEPEALSLFVMITPECEVLGQADVTINGGTAPFNYDWADLTGTNDPEDRTDLVVGTYSLTVTDINGCILIEDGIGVPDCSPDSCDYFYGLDSMIVQAVDCAIGAQVCLDIPLENLADFTVKVDGVDYLGSFEGCNWDTIVTYPYFNLFGQGALGPYEITSWVVGNTSYSGTFADINGLVDSMNTWVPTSNWMINTTAQLISGGDPNLGFGAMMVNATDFGVSSTLTPDFAGVPTGLSINLLPGYYEIILRDTIADCSDTLQANVFCTTTDTIYTEVEIFDTDTICFNDLELFGSIDTIYNSCGDLAFTTFEVYNDSCLIFTGTAIGTDTACIVYCDEYNICDTTIVIIEVLLPYDLLLDSLCINQTATTCIDTSQLEFRSDIISMRNICPELSGESIDFELDTVNYCVTYTAFSMGIDTACIELCDANGICDTIRFFIDANCASTAPELVIDTVFINETDTFCVDRSEIVGDFLSLDNFCGDLSNGNVDFFIDESTLCVEYTGLELGKDTACVVLCNEIGICDTTYFCILVVPYFDPPLVNDDFDTTNVGTPVVIDIKSNDILFGGLDTAYILIPPSYGTATLNLDCSLTYNPSDEFCERSDQLSYVACTPNGCDTAVVNIWIACVDIVIFNAVSPNRDGINDVFYIAGIEDFPDAELLIYNRWGNVVYSTVGYQNDWRGTWDGDKDLPDGTYFYFLRLHDEEERDFKGYLELYR